MLLGFTVSGWLINIAEPPWGWLISIPESALSLTHLEVTLWPILQALHHSNTHKMFSLMFLIWAYGSKHYLNFHSGDVGFLFNLEYDSECSSPGWINDGQSHPRTSGFQVLCPMCSKNEIYRKQEGEFRKFYSRIINWGLRERKRVGSRIGVGPWKCGIIELLV